MKVLLKLPLSPYSGYGNDGIGITRALMRAGADVYLDPAVTAPPLPQDIALLLTKRLVAPFDLCIHHVDPTQLGLTPEARRASRLTVAWTMWEYATVANMPGRSTLRKRLKNYDLVVGYDRVTTEAFDPFVTTQAATIQGGFWPEEWPYLERDWSGDRFGFCMTGQLHERKDPFVAITAFRELKEELPEEFEPAELHLKTNVPGLHMAMEQWVPKLRVHYTVWPTEVLREFYGAQHVLLAPSRGEGKNVPALEFLSTGGTVIATNWGGHTNWLSTEYAYPLNYTLAPVSNTKPNCFNARADKEHLKALMLHVFRNRDEARRKGEAGSRVIPAMCNWDTVVQRLMQSLADRTDTGKALLTSYWRSTESSRNQVSIG